MFAGLISALIDAVYQLPPVRFLMGFVDPRWRPLWAALWLAVIAYVLLRTMNLVGERRARLKVMRESYAPVEPRAPGDPVVPITPAEEPGGIRLPANSVAERLDLVPPRVLFGAIGVAAIVALAVALSIGRGGTDPATASAIDTANLTRTSPVPQAEIAPFAFRSRGGRAVDDDCVMTFEVTAGTAAPWRITVHVMDTAGTVIAQDAKQVSSLLPGVFVDFRFRHVDCDEIESWQFQGETRAARQ